MELEESTCVTSDSTTKPQSSRQYSTGAQRQKYRSMEQNRKPRDKSTNLWSPSLTKEARIYNGKKTTSLTSCAGKTGQPPVKE